MGDAVVCNDGVDCTVDTCETEVGCAIVADDLRCDDDDPCTDNICTETGCENVAKPDGSMCFFDESCGGVGICIEQACVVVDSPDGTPCNDDEICTEQDVCQAGVCIGLLPEEPPTGLRLSELVPASATVSDFNTCSDEQPVQVQQLLAVEVDDVGSPSHTKFIWAGQPLSPQGGSCTQRGSWPVQLLNQGPVDENADRDGAPADEAPVPDVFPEPLSCQTPILLTTMMPQAPDPTPGEPWEADVEPDPDTFSHVLTWVDAKYLLKVVDSDLGKRIVVVHVNESHLGREPRVEVFNLDGIMIDSAPLNANFEASNLAMVQDPVTHELTLVVAPRQRTYCHFCEPGPPPPPSGITQWPPMEWPVFRFSLPLPNSRVFPGDIVDDDTQFVLGPTTALYVNRKTTGEDPPMALLNIDHMAVLQQEGALAVAGEFSVHD
ncbi:MAG: hypothetical protein GY822_18165, partial [Deltaproteobacteria bacterium]|nr:hypothetical protein [Deltaproteobacteria bacterium]